MIVIVVIGVYLVVAFVASSLLGRRMRRNRPPLCVRAGDDVQADITPALRRSR